MSIECVLDTPITVLVVGGTGESYPGDSRTDVTGMLRAVADELDGRFVCRWIGYPASYGPTPRARGMSYERSIDIGVDEVCRELDATSGSVMMIGYSQGAVVIRTALHELNRRRAAGLGRVIGVGLVADPHQPPGVVASCDGWGVAGAGVELPESVPAYWVGDPDDVICNASPDSLIRDIADLTVSMTLSELVTWRHSVVDMLRHNAFQNANATMLHPRQWRTDLGRLRTAGREALGYLPSRIGWGSAMLRNRIGGRHTSYGVEPHRRSSVTNGDATGCQALARWMQVQATFVESIGSDDSSGHCGQAQVSAA